MERPNGSARDQGRDAAAARLVRGAVFRLALALGIAAFTAVLGLAALSARTQQLQAAQPAATGGGTLVGADRVTDEAHAGASSALRNDI